MTKKVLIADDEPNIVISLEFLMGHCGYVVSVARNGEEALQQVAAFKPDLILLDVMLPLRDGFDVCRKIRENTGFLATKIIMLTARGHEAEIAKGYAMGADAYITKPFGTKELLGQVKRLLGESA
jgi:two-component system, OmpR family, alkaline phosphatase synthesis response regulator PhoP